VIRLQATDYLLRVMVLTHAKAKAKGTILMDDIDDTWEVGAGGEVSDRTGRKYGVLRSRTEALGGEANPGEHISEKEEIGAQVGALASAKAIVQQSFYEELEAAVRKHIRYLREVAEMQDIKLPKWYLVVKRSMDIFVGIVGLILLSPLFLVVAALIKIDSRGPVFFGQERVGKNGKLFKMYKFRTMVVDAEKRTGPVWAVDNDPRITFTGKIMRRSKIDELPQLVNLIKGEMSMVGPRPERPFFVNQFMEIIPGYARRLEVPPGLTGAAQLRNGYDRHPADVIRKLRFDVTYMKKMSLSMDLRLLAETFGAIFTGKV
jgi:lipopolysaccharide/colanic/teichoic acid biosynthesis glycosyltransferase